MTERFPVVVVSGARQVGKSTLLQHALPDWTSVVFDPATDIGNARQDPDLFLDNHPCPVILDEIQYSPEVVPAIKRRVDKTGTPGQFVLTGSQQWAVLKSASESLAGRAIFLDLEGFCLSEIAEETREDHWLQRYLEAPDTFVSSLTAEMPRIKLPRTVYEQLWWGFLPGADSLEAEWIADYYRSYLRTYIERDARLLADVSDWQQFGRFLQLASALTAQEINFSQLGREIGVTPQTAQRWISVLKGTFQWYEVPPYHGNTIKRISKKTKGYIADTGLACSVNMISTPTAIGGHPMAGALFETAVFAEIRKLASTMSAPPSIYHWRVYSGSEVDVLLERDGRFYPIEIKLGTRPTKSDTNGMKAFRETYTDLNIAPGLVICPAEKPEQLTENDYILPWNCI